MERNDTLIGFYILSTVIFLISGMDVSFFYSVVVNLFILATYFMLYYDFTNYRSHSQYLLKREIKPFYSSLINGVLLLGMGRIIYNYGVYIFSWNTSVYNTYQLIIESLFGIIFIILLLRFIFKDVLEVSLKTPSDDLFSKSFSEKTLIRFKTTKQSKEEPKREDSLKEKQKEEIIREKGEEEIMEEKEEIKRLPVIIITTD